MELAQIQEQVIREVQGFEKKSSTPFKRFSMAATSRTTKAWKVEDLPLTMFPPVCVRCRADAAKLLVCNWADIGGPQQKIPYCQSCLDALLKAEGLPAPRPLKGRPTNVVEME
jgi:hypothetical protein